MKRSVVGVEVVGIHAVEGMVLGVPSGGFAVVVVIGQVGRVARMRELRIRRGRWRCFVSQLCLFVFVQMVVLPAPRFACGIVVVEPVCNTRVAVHVVDSSIGTVRLKRRDPDRGDRVGAGIDELANGQDEWL